MQPSNTQSVEHPALQLLAARPDVFARRGHIAESWRVRNGKKFGPYYRLAYRDGDRQRSVYLGCAGELVQEVRRRLAAIQRPRTEYRAIERLQRQLRAAVRVDRQNISSLLRPFGLRLKGFELRGIRISPLRRFLPSRHCLMPRVSAGRLKHPNLRHNCESPQTRMAKFLAARDRLQGIGE